MPISPGAVAGIGAAGDLIGGLFGFIGGEAEAKAYKQAAKYSHQNAIISEEAGEIKLQQESRKIFKTLGSQQAGYAGAGLTTGGSAQAVIRDSVSQGALQKAIVNEQTQINVIGYLSQEAQFKGMAEAADAAAKGGLLSGIFSAAAAVAPFVLSDRRLKRDINQIGTHGALGIYRFRFNNDDEQHVGVMADEVAAHAPHALGPMIEGYATVAYGKLGLSHLLEMS